MKYTVKYWKDQHYWDGGEATVERDDYTLEQAEIRFTELLFDGMYAVEIFNTESGETYLHSNE